MLNCYSIIFDFSPKVSLSDKGQSLGDFNSLKECIQAAKIFTKQNPYFEKLAWDDFFEVAHYFKVIQYKKGLDETPVIREALAIVTLDIILEDNPSDLSSYSFDQ
jgi:hypothetical protein